MSPSPLRLGVAGLALLSSNVLAQNTIDPRLAARLDTKTGSAIAGLVDSARRESIPTEPLIDRALEGASKRAASQKIITSVRTLMRELSTARAILGPTSTDADVAAGAAALRSGVPVGDLERVRNARSNVRVATAIGVLSEFVRRGVPTDTATSIVVTLMQGQVSDEQLLALEQQVYVDIAAGRPAATAVAGRAELLGQVLAGNLPPGSGGRNATLPSPAGTRGTSVGLPPTSGVAGQLQPSDASAPKAKPPASPRGKPRRP